MNGVTSTGFNRPTFTEIRNRILEEFKNILGPVNTGEESIIWQQINIQAEREDLIWQALESVYLNSYPQTASGVSLDGAVQLIGITRRSATRTNVSVVLTGDASTVIPQGSQASTVNGDLFELVEEVVLNQQGQGTGQMQATESGSILALANNLINIETPVSGWDTITNPNDGQTGRDTETDSELLQRFLKSNQLFGAGTVEAIKSRLTQQVEDVTSVTIIENRTDFIDSAGRPPHSFEVLVTGGQRDDIANLIWQLKPAGIETFGNISELVEDSAGELQQIKFSRPQNSYIWIQAELTVNSDQFPADGIAEIENNLLHYGDDTEVGNNVIYQSLFTPIYKTSGILSVDLKIGKTVSPTAVLVPYVRQNLDINSNQIAKYAIDRMDIKIV